MLPWGVSRVSARKRGKFSGAVHSHRPSPRAHHPPLSSSSLPRAGYDDREGAQEAVFFRKEDEKLLKSLLAKVRAQAEANDVHGAAGARSAELSALNAIVGSKLSDKEKDAVLEWKHTHY